MELALASYPGCTLTAPPGDAAPYGMFTREHLRRTPWTHAAVLPDGSRVPIPAPADAPPPRAAPDPSATTTSPEPPPGRPGGAAGHGGWGALGDKGGDANLGVWARPTPAYAWLRAFLTVERLRELLPEAAPLAGGAVRLPNLRAVNFVLHGLLGEGGAAEPGSTRRPRRSASGCARGSSTYRRSCCDGSVETEERRALRALTRRFVEREVRPHLDAWERAGEDREAGTRPPPRPACSASAFPPTPAARAATRSTSLW